WPALFLSLGFNFLEYGLDPAGDATGPEWGWLFCAAVFALMGAVPLLVLLRPAVLARTFWPPAAMPDVSVARGLGLPTPGWRPPPVDARPFASAAPAPRRGAEPDATGDEGGGPA